MTAFDTTNARITFTAPSNGSVLVRLRVADKGSVSKPTVLLGVLDGTTVRARQTPISCIAGQGGVATPLIQYEIVSLVTGLTGGNSYTWDAAYGVQVAQASSNFGWGGPNDTTTTNAYGALSYEIWDTANLLAGILYDPTVAVTQATTAASVMTALDTTNLRLSFTSPASGRVLVRLRGAGSGASTLPSVHLGVLSGATVVGRQVAHAVFSNAVATGLAAYHSEFVVSVTPNTALTWDAAFAVETGVASSKIAYGGPDDALGTDAWGGFTFEVWSA